LPRPTSPLFPYTTLFRSRSAGINLAARSREPHMRHPLLDILAKAASGLLFISESEAELEPVLWENIPDPGEKRLRALIDIDADRSEEHTSELQSRVDLVC